MLNQIHSTQHLLTYLLRSYQCWRQESQLSGCKHDIQCAIWHNVTALSTICCDIYILLLYCQLYLCLTPRTVLTTCTVHVFMLLLLVFEFLQLYYILFVFLYLCTSFIIIIICVDVLNLIISSCLCHMMNQEMQFQIIQSNSSNFCPETILQQMYTRITINNLFLNSSTFPNLSDKWELCRRYEV